MDEAWHDLSILANCEKEWAEQMVCSDNFREATRIF
jgi:hypothetical protein